MTATYLSRHRIPRFELLRPRSLEDLGGIHGSDLHWAFMAGGVDLKREMKAGRRIDLLVDLKQLEGAREIAHDGTTLRIGGCVTHAEVVESHLMSQLLPDVARIWSGLGNERVRTVGTIAGNIVAGAPQYHAAPIFAALGAVLHTCDLSSQSRVPIDQRSLEQVRAGHVLVMNVEVKVSPQTRVSFIADLPTARVALAVVAAEGQGIEGRHLSVAVQGRDTLSVYRSPLESFDAANEVIPELATELSPVVVDAEHWWDRSLPRTARMRWVEAVLRARLVELTVDARAGMAARPGTRP